MLPDQQSKSLPGHESVWDYPRPPRLEKVHESLKVVFGNCVVAETKRGYRILETSHPPVYYFPRSDVREGFLVREPGSSFCEFKGRAEYWSLSVQGDVAKRTAWSYADPVLEFSAIADFIAFYASRVQECWVGEDRVKPQEGDFYGRWITDRILGPFKGGPGTYGW